MASPLRRSVTYRERDKSVRSKCYHEISFHSVQIRLIKGNSSIEERKEEDVKFMLRMCQRCVTISCTTEQLRYSRGHSCDNYFH